MQILFDDIELYYLITSGKSHKYRGLPGKKKLVEHLQVLYQILRTIEDIYQLSTYNSINYKLVKGSLTILLPSDGLSDMQLETVVEDSKITFLSLKQQP